MSVSEIDDEVLEDRKKAMVKLYESMENVRKSTHGKCSFLIRTNGDISIVLDRRKVDVDNFPFQRDRLICYNPDADRLYVDYLDRVNGTRSGLQNLEPIKEISGPFLTTCRVKPATDYNSEQDDSNYKFKFDMNLPETQQGLIQSILEENKMLKEGIKSKDSQVQKLRKRTRHYKQQNENLREEVSTLNSVIESVTDEAYESNREAAVLKAKVNEGEALRRKKDSESKKKIEDASKKGREEAMNDVEFVKSKANEISEVADMLEGSDDVSQMKLDEIEAQVRELNGTIAELEGNSE